MCNKEEKEVNWGQEIVRCVEGGNHAAAMQALEQAAQADLRFGGGVYVKLLQLVKSQKKKQRK